MTDREQMHGGSSQPTVRDSAYDHHKLRPIHILNHLRMHMSTSTNLVCLLLQVTRSLRLLHNHTNDMKLCPSPLLTMIWEKRKLEMGSILSANALSFDQRFLDSSRHR